MPPGAAAAFSPVSAEEEMGTLRSIIAELQRDFFEAAEPEIESLRTSVSRLKPFEAAVLQLSSENEGILAQAAELQAMGVSGDDPTEPNCDESWKPPEPWVSNCVALGEWGPGFPGVRSDDSSDSDRSFLG